MPQQSPRSIFTPAHQARLKELQQLQQDHELSRKEQSEMQDLANKWQRAYNAHLIAEKRQSS